MAIFDLKSQDLKKYLEDGKMAEELSQTKIEQLNKMPMLICMDIIVYAVSIDVYKDYYLFNYNLFSSPLWDIFYRREIQKIYK